MLEIQLLGPPVVSVDRQPLEVDTRKAVALLAYLVVEGEVLRDSAAAMFWGESTEERARASLRRTLSSLRSGLGSDAVSADRLRLRLEPATTSDVQLFNSELAKPASHNHNPEDVCASCIPHLKRATGLYRGDFLAGFQVRDAVEFEDWTRTVTETFRLRAGGAFQRLGIGYASAGHYPQAIEAVTRWTELDPLHEPAHRMLMLLNAWAGDRPGAVASYRNFVGTVDRELGVSPLDETTELYEAILDDDLPPAPGLRRQPKSHPSSAAPKPAKMLDRVSELDRLLLSVDRRLGVGKLVVIDGAAWMGKTRLLEEFVQMSTATQTTVAVARSFQMERSLPYGVASQIIKALAPAIDRYRDEIPVWALQEASRIVPALWPEVPVPTVDVLGELRIFEAIEQILSVLGHSQPSIVVVEDLQWIDPASGELLLYLVNRLEQVPILLVVSYRTGERLEQNSRALVAAAGEHLTLEPLDASTLHPAMVRGHRLPELLNRTGGVPILVLEELKGNGSHDGMTRYMESSLAAVSDLSSQILDAASVLAGLSTTDLLQEVSGRSESELVEGVEELLRAGILREVAGSNTLDFTLESMRDVVYQSTTLIRRRHLHRRVAVTLSSSQRTRNDARLAGATAAHFAEAGDEGSAVHWYRVAAGLAREVYAYAEAQEFLERALALGDEDVAWVRLQLGEMSIARGDYQSGLSHLTIGASRAAGATLALIEHRFGQANRMLGRFELAETNYQNAAAEHPEPADLYSDWALLQHRIGNQSEASELAERAVSSALATGDAGLRARVYNISAVVEQDPAKAIQLLDLAIVGDDDQVSRLATLNNRAHILSELQKPDEAIVLLNEAISIAQETGHRHREAALLSHLADCYHRQGNTALAEKTQEAAVTLFADIDSGQWEPEVWLMTRW
ncbi:MAG TPA: BTAD domain-containing putative transcriptional regulator [Acidimicrobiia bacterium]